MQRTTEFRRAAAACAVGCAAFLAWTLLPGRSAYQDSLLSDSLCLLGMVALAAVAWHEALRANGRRRIHLVLLGLAGASWAAGQTVWSVYELVLRQEAPFPSSADVGFLLFVPFAGIATLLLPEAPTTLRARLRVGLDGCLIGGALLFLCWTTFLGRAYENGADRPLAAVIALAYPVSDIVLVTIALSVLARLQSGRSRTQPLLLAAGLVAFVMADGGFALLSMRGTSHSGVPTDLGWLAGGLLMALSALAPIPEPSSVPRQSRALSALPYVPLMLAAVGTLWSGMANDGLGPAETMIGGAVVVLVVVRQVLGVIENGRLTRSLADREEHYRSLVQGSSDVLTICDSEGVIRFISPALRHVFGFEPDDLVGTNVGELVHPEDTVRVTGEVLAVAEQGAGASATIACRYKHSDGRWLHVEAVVTNHLAHRTIAGLVFNTRDVTERKELERQLTHQAFHDPLTGLANRSLFRDRVHHALALRTRTHAPLAVLFLDLDGFKAINDSLGHGVGDELLKSVAGRLRSVVRPGDTVSRLGGDEFAVLLEDLEGLHAAQQIASRFLEELHTAFSIKGHEVFVGASVGIALAGAEDDADEVLRNADLAMYRAKALGRNRCELFEQDMHAAALERMEIENDLRHAVVRGELRLHYQPVVELATGRIVGVEALVRWQHPTRGLVPPMDFINVAEESGLIVPVGRWVLSEACRQVARWRRETGEPLKLSVNLSARQLQAPRLAEHVAKTLRSTGVAPQDLVLEITESMLVDDADRTIAKLHLLREIGVRLAIDDFGTGYSSLNYLRRLPVDVLKIDRSFVKGIGTESELTALTGAIVGIGRDLGLDVVAEGIEETVQLDALRGMGCELGQGFLYARPLPPAELADLVHAGRVLRVPERATA